MPQQPSPGTPPPPSNSGANRKSDTVNRKSTPPPGYKPTKLGWLPEEWEVARLGEVTKVNQGLQISIANRLTKAVPGAKKYITVQYLNGGKSAEYVLNPNDSVCCEPNDILMTRTGNTGLVVIGASGVYHNNFFKIKTDPHKVDKPYLTYFLRSPETQYKILVQAGTSTIPDLNHGDFYSIRIPLPPLPEQHRIAHCLTTWDRAITTTRHLLDALRTRKRGLMQRLLTGEVRLPGFSGEWKNMRAGQLFKSVSNKNHDGEFEVLSVTQDKGVIPRNEVGIDIKYDKASLSSYKKISEGDFVISLRSFQGGIEYSHYTGLVSPAYIVLRGSDKANPIFFTEFFKTETFINRLNSIIYGIRDGKQISYKEFSSLKILLPPINEQKAIGKIISKIQYEIALYEQKLTALETQKRGLMQQLLTGQKRLPA